MEKAKAIGKKCLFVYDTVLPVICFCAIFVTFMLNIISRYILRHAVPWNYEISVLGYMWCMYFGVGHAMNGDEHVVFSLVYDQMKPVVQYGMKLFYNIFLFVLMAIAYVPCWKAMFSSSMRTGVLKLPYTVAFAPFMIMYTEIMIRTLVNIYRARRDYHAGKFSPAESRGEDVGKIDEQEGGAGE